VVHNIMASASRRISKNRHLTGDLRNLGFVR
jgi:hypothetical protein